MTNRGVDPAAPTIQPIGFHVSVSSEWLVSAVSANIGDFLPCSANDLLGQPVTAVFSDDALHDIRNRMALLRGDESTEHLLQFPLVRQGKPFDLSIYRHGDGFGIDAEPCDEHGFGAPTGIVEGMLARVEATNDAGSLCAEAAKQLRTLTGFDRVFISAEGKLLGQSVRSGSDQVDPDAMTPAKGDLAIVDCNAVPVPILISSQEGSTWPRSTLRSPTDVEASGLAAIGARAALILPLARDGRAWGQVGCYHGSPRHVSAERRNIARLFASIMSLRIEIAEFRRGV